MYFELQGLGQSFFKLCPTKFIVGNFSLFWNFESFDLLSFLVLLIEANFFSLSAHAPRKVLKMAAKSKNDPQLVFPLFDFSTQTQTKTESQKGPLFCSLALLFTAQANADPGPFKLGKSFTNSCRPYTQATLIGFWRQKSSRVPEI